MSCQPARRLCAVRAIIPADGSYPTAFINNRDWLNLEQSISRPAAGKGTIAIKAIGHGRNERIGGLGGLFA
jgi:hypothetical protein